MTGVTREDGGLQRLTTGNVGKGDEVGLVITEGDKADVGLHRVTKGMEDYRE